jgi:hypothetical protein
MNMMLEKKKLKKDMDLKKTTFHASLFENGLNRF